MSTILYIKTILQLSSSRLSIFYLRAVSIGEQTYIRGVQELDINTALHCGSINGCNTCSRVCSIAGLRTRKLIGWQSVSTVLHCGCGVAAAPAVLICFGTSGRGDPGMCTTI